MEAVKRGKSELISLLQKAGAQLCMSQLATASALCTAVAEVDGPMVRRLLKAGADVNAGAWASKAAGLPVSVRLKMFMHYNTSHYTYHL